MSDSIVLILGVICAGLGGELFVRGAVGMARWARISPAIIGVTAVAFATSSPELSVAINSALAGRPQISVGDVLGSNVLNVALILAIALVISGIQSPRDSIRRDFPVALGVPVAIGILCLDGRLSRLDGILMLAMFLAWLVATVVEAMRQRGTAEKEGGAGRGWQVVAFSCAGLAVLFAAGKLIVMGAKGVAISLGMDEFVIGATIVALGTSTPELATTLMAKLRGHDEIGLGNILGSNIFNGLLIIAVAAVICPITVNWKEIAVALVFGLVAVILTYPSRKGFIGRWRGVLLLALFAVYVAAILQR